MFRLVKRVGNFFMDIIEVFVISMSVFIVFYLFLMQPHQVKGSSMYPTFVDKEYLMTDKITYKTRTPMIGDVVVFKAPMNESIDFIKRVIGTPGDTVMIKEGKVYVNGKRLNEYYLPPEYTTKPGKFMKEGVSIQVAAGEYIVFGDNRGHSSDSREWGAVPLENFIGKAFLRYWPPGKVMVIKNAFKGTGEGEFF